MGGRLGLHQVGNVEMPSRARVSAFGWGAGSAEACRLYCLAASICLNLALTLKQGGNLLPTDRPGR